MFSCAEDSSYQKQNEGVEKRLLLSGVHFQLPTRFFYVGICHRAAMN